MRRRGIHPYISGACNDDPQVAFFAGCAVLLVPQAALPETLSEALEAAYGDNPTITAQRASVRVADENVPIARAAGLPTLDGTATYQENVLKGEPAPGGFFSDPDRQLVGSLNATVPLITFGAVRNSVRGRNRASRRAAWGLRSTESDLFTAVVGAYMDVLRDEAVVQLNQRNAEVMRFTLRETMERQNAGNRGPTDVAQAEARVALAESQLETAQARPDLQPRRLYSSRWAPAGHLSPATAAAAMPTSTAGRGPRWRWKAIPQLLRRTANGWPRRPTSRRPTPSAYRGSTRSAGWNHYDYLGSLDPARHHATATRAPPPFVGVQLRVPFFQGGRLSAEVRQAQARHSLAIETSARCRTHA